MRGIDKVGSTKTKAYQIDQTNYKCDKVDIIYCQKGGSAKLGWRRRGDIKVYIYYIYYI